ncbi:WXG100 family type VII secretion target [Mycobacterium xenopi]|uniref:WXG100 family type VII secretion target n=1 Tax=Mycobacterium xenopi TaxID=1789 RepID=UPI000A149B8C|nr:WXG100 family type VII secretion target [Mycobacterium xenopi]ORX14148.1 hypothetical protein AWC32_14300 [Mycobacterium xenopi]SPX94846.1 esat-6 like protein EsxG [Mycobacterium xenopi]
MGLLDANVPQLAASHSSFTDQAALFQSTVHSAEQSALAAQANHQGESALAFQQAHAHFVEVANKMNQLLMIAGQNIGEAGTNYTVGDADGVHGYQAGLGALPGGLPNVHS